ncbi:MAG: rod shape-determining protein MreC [Muribaculaceae bacterium]
MRNLINFFLRYSTWFVFIIYVVISCTLLFKSNPYQHYVYLTSANKVSASVYNGMSNITSYFYLRDINNDLQTRNAMLENELINLKSTLRDYKLKQYENDSTTIPAQYRQFEFIIAHVISNSISKPLNYITINKGTIDGIKPEMGIVDQNGVVGIVNIVGEHASRVISLLNPHFRLSCKVKGSDSFGSLVWDGKSPYNAVLEEMPRHVKFAKGDTIVTSGYSSVFPEGIIVGTIAGRKIENNDNSYSLIIKLTTDFTQLSTVRAIKNNFSEELQNLVKEEDK